MVLDKYKCKRDVQFYCSFSILLSNYRAIFHTNSSMHLPQKSSRGWISKTFGVWKFLLQHDSQNSCRSCTKRMSDTNNIKGIGVLLLVPIKCFCQQMLLFQAFVNIGCSVWHALWMKKILKFFSLKKQNKKEIVFFGEEIVLYSFFLTLCPIHSSLIGLIGRGSPSAFKSVTISWKCKFNQRIIMSKSKETQQKLW